MQNFNNIDKITIYLFTGSYPFEIHREESFLKQEINELLNSELFNIVIVPINTKGKKLPFDSRITLDTTLGEYLITNHFEKILIIGKYLFTFFFWRCVFFYGVSFLSFKNIINYALGYNSFLQTRRYFKEKFLKSGVELNRTIFYTFWFTNETNAILSFKKENKLPIKVVTRTHGGDLYEERSIKPFRHEIIKFMDKVYAVSDFGTAYLKNRFKNEYSKFETLKIGTYNFVKEDKYQKSSNVTIVSCAYIIPLKRIDKIYEALYSFSSKNNLILRWIHIGGGETNLVFNNQDNLPIESKTKFSYEFLGNLSNEEVHNFYKTHSVDLLISLSETEGLPVSMMEAQSYFIPIVATNVGGVPEIVNNQNGHLVPKDFTSEQVVQALEHIIFNKDYLNYRKNSYESWCLKHNASIIYKKMIDEFVELAHN